MYNVSEKQLLKISTHETCIQVIAVLCKKYQFLNNSWMRFHRKVQLSIFYRQHFVCAYDSEKKTVLANVSANRLHLW